MNNTMNYIRESFIYAVMGRFVDEYHISLTSVYKVELSGFTQRLIEMTKFIENANFSTAERFDFYRVFLIDECRTYVDTINGVYDIDLLNDLAYTLAKEKGFINDIDRREKTE